jgi:WD40 repeat protein
VLSRLITSSGTRNVVSEDNLIRWLGNEDKIPPGIVRTALRNLEHSARLIRCEPRRGVNYYEINSEFLVPWIQREAIARETQRQVYDLSQQEAKKQRERFQKIRLRVMYAVAGGVILIALMMVSRYKNEKTLRLHSVADNLAVRALMDSGEIGQLLATEAVAIDDKEDRSHFSGLIGTALCTALSSPLAPLRKFAGAVGSISTDTAGRLLAATADSRIMLWDLAHSRSNPESIGEFEFATFQSVALSRDGSQLVAGTHDGRLFLWQLGGNRGEPEIFDADTSTVYGVDISPDGHRVAAASRDGLIRIWDLGQGEQSRRNLPTGGLMAWSVRFANDGKTLFTGSVKGGIQRWDLRTQKPVAGLPGVSLDLSADGMWLASGTIDGKIRVWRTSDLQKPEREIEAHRGAVRSVALSRDGSELASAGEDSTVQVWDVRSSTPVRTMLGMHHGWATSVRFTHDGNGLHSGGIDGELKRWVDVRGRNEYPVTVSPQRGDRGTVSSAAMNMSAGVVVALVSKRSPSLPWLFGSGPLGSERMAAASTSGGSVQLYDLGSETGLRQLAAGAKNLAIALSGDGKSVAIADHDSVRILRVDESNLRPVAFGQAKDSLTVLALSGDGIQLAAAGQDNVVRVWDTRQPGKTPKRLRGVSGKVRSLTFSADAKSIAAGSDSGVVRVWGLARPDTSLEIEAHVGMVRSLTFSSDGQLLASGGNDGKVSIWNLADPHKTAVVFPAGEAAVTAVLFRKDDRLIFAGSSDGTIDFWSMQEGNASPARLDTHAGAVRAIALSERSDTLYSIGVDGRVLGWIINRQGLAKRICERVGRNLSFAEWRLFVPSDIRYELPCPEHGSPPENIDAIKKAIRQGDDGNARRMRKAISKLDSSQEYDVDAGIKFFRAEQLARSGQVDSAIAVAREVTSLSSSSAQRREGLDDVVAVLIARAKALTDSGNYRETNQLVTKITAFSADGGKLAAREISRIVQPIILDPALKLAEAGQVDSALVLFEQARTLLGDDKIPPYYWNDLCWYGALWRRAPDIMRACEQAVKMRPLDGHYRDSRGVARALSGDRAGAIEDFAYYIGFSDDSIIKRDREQWIKTLRAKGDPFTPKVLQGLLRD